MKLTINYEYNLSLQKYEMTSFTYGNTSTISVSANNSKVNFGSRKHPSWKTVGNIHSSGSNSINLNHFTLSNNVCPKCNKRHYNFINSGNIQMEQTLTGNKGDNGPFSFWGL